MLTTRTPKRERWLQSHLTKYLSSRLVMQSLTQSPFSVKYIAVVSCTTYDIQGHVFQMIEIVLWNMSVKVTLLS